MVDINGLPLLERQIHKLKKAGIYKIFISVNYLKELIIKYFGDGSELEWKYYLHEEKNGHCRSFGFNAKFARLWTNCYKW